MNAMAWRIAPYLLVAVLTLFAWLQRQTLAQQETTLKTYGAVIESQGKQIGDLAERLTSQRLDLAALTAQQEGFRAALDERELDFERLKDEDSEVRRWADTVLPAGIVRLQQRPAITGAAGYDQYLRTRDALHATGQPAEDKRRPAADD
jgi:LysB family phage lysis regulatory protein